MKDRIPNRHLHIIGCDPATPQPVPIRHQSPAPPVEDIMLEIEQFESLRTVAITRRTRIFVRRVTAITVLAALALAASGCIGPRPLRGGRAVTAPNPAGGVAQTLLQGDNPAQVTRQTQHTIRTLIFRLETNTLSRSHAPTLLTDVQETHATAELGAAQKDTAREFAAKLSSLRSTVWVGLALFMFGLASLFWPPLKLIIGSATTSAAITLGGLALMILPTLIVGNELLILVTVASGVALWFLAHRHGHLRGQLSASPPPSSSSSCLSSSSSPSSSSFSSSPSIPKP